MTSRPRCLPKKNSGLCGNICGGTTGCLPGAPRLSLLKPPSNQGRQHTGRGSRWASHTTPGRARRRCLLNALPVERTRRATACTRIVRHPRNGHATRVVATAARTVGASSTQGVTSEGRSRYHIVGMALFGTRLLVADSSGGHPMTVEPPCDCTDNPCTCIRVGGDSPSEYVLRDAVKYWPCPTGPNGEQCQWRRPDHNGVHRAFVDGAWVRWEREPTP